MSAGKRAPAGLSVERQFADGSSLTMLRFSTAGSVDDGKSTLIGRLLHDTGNIYSDHLTQLQQSSKKFGSESLAFALVTDGLKAEREQGITIDVAYRYFSTSKRRYILADAPGHEQYTRNMATAASTAQVTILVVDVEKGVLPQTRRHAFIASLMGVPRLLVAVNKMDRVNYDEAAFDRVRAEFLEFSPRLRVRELRFLPVSAIEGENVVRRSNRMPWYHSDTLLEYLDSVYTAGDTNFVDLRFPVQHVLGPNTGHRSYAGTVASGFLRPGDEIVVLPSRKTSTVRSIEVLKQGTLTSLEEAYPPMSVSITLNDQLDISRGNLIAKPQNIPTVESSLDALLVWMDEAPLTLKTPYILQHTSRQTRAFIQNLEYKIDINTLGRTRSEMLGATEVKLNDIARVNLTTVDTLFVDSYERNRQTGSFILIDPATFRTVAGGMIIERAPHSGRPVSNLTNLHSEPSLITPQERESKFGAPARTIWLTGLSGSGKSTIAKSVERKLFGEGRLIYRLDGDNLRTGLNKDLGFSQDDRSENIRRVAEVAKLFNDAGVSVIAAFISPFNKDRELAQAIIGTERFYEVYLSTPLEVCEQRDPHGLYGKARKGEISEFTGISSPYEAPATPSLVVNTAELTLEQCEQLVTQLLR